MKNDTPVKEINKEDEAKQVLIDAQNTKINACVKEISVALEKFGCEISVAMLCTTNGNIPQIKIVIKQ